VLTKGHRIADYGLSFFAVAVFFFALLVLYVVTHMNDEGTGGVREDVEEMGYGGTLVMDRSRW
jgi:hypothetical protein